MSTFDFWDAYDALNEFFMTDFDKNSADDGLFYHFYSDIDDLLNSLKVGAIYSNKNAFRAQYDAKAAANDASYVCFTTQREGKQRAAMNFCGPYGIAFRNLESFAKRKEHILFSPDEAYIGEVPMLNRYRVSADGKVHKKLDPKRDDFQLSAIGKMKIDGKIAYFVSGGRGRNLGGKHLSSKLLYSDADENGVPGPNDKLYKTLWDWFDKGSRSDRGMMYYRFEGLQGNDLGKPTQLFVGKNGKSYPVNVENQNNENYVPWGWETEIGQGNLVSAKSRPEVLSEKASKAPNAAVCFQWADKPRAGIEVLDVIGVGPFKAEDDEGRTLFRIDMVNSSSKGGYAGASLLLVDSDTNDFYKGEEDSVIVSGSKAKSGVTKDTLPQNLLLGEKQARLFASLYDEHEYRVYIRGKHNLFFRPTDIKNIVLPSTLVISAVRSDVFDLHAFCEDVDGGELADFPSDPKEFSRLALDREYVQSRKKEAEKKELAIGIYPVIRLLFELLTGKYRDVNVEFIGSPSSRSISLRTKVYSKKSNEHQRILVEASKLVPDLKDERTAKLRWHDGDTVVAPLKWIGAGDCPADLQGMDGALARIGAEVIVIGYDKAGKKYVLFVDNAHKATAFYELPGGGLPSPSASFEWLAQQRLQMKAGFGYGAYDDERDLWKGSSHISGLAETGYALIVDEKKIAKDKTVEWPYSYYRLFTAKYTQLLPSADKRLQKLTYSHDNREQIKNDLSLKAKDSQGYECFLEWIPADSLRSNRHINRRYASILDIIDRL